MRPDDLVRAGEWSLLDQRGMPPIDHDRLRAYRRSRLREQLECLDADVALLHNPISLRYAIEYRSYALFQSRIPTAYCLFPLDGPVVACATYGAEADVDDIRPGVALSYFDGGEELHRAAADLAAQIDAYLSEIGATRRRVALEYVNPSIVQALERRGITALDGTVVAERARLIKSADELACMRWAVAVAEHGIAAVEGAIEPGVTETQLWGLLNYTNLANDGDWHDGRMLASGPRTNPWLQEASSRRVEAGDLVAFDTDMVGPFGYFADISRTVFCGPGSPTARQRELYGHAVAEVEHNLGLVRPGITLRQFQEKAYIQPEEFHEQSYPCIVHAVGMCDEYPRIDPIHRGPNRYDDTLEPGMVLCIESYVGAVGERDGVKLEQQVVVTDDGCEQLTSYPYNEKLLS